MLAGVCMRFTLRDLLWLTVVVGLSLGWYFAYQRLTMPPKLYRDEEIWNRNGQYFDEYDRYGVARPPGDQGVVPQGTSIPLSQVFKTLGIDSKRLTDFRHTQYNSSISLHWQISPSYDLWCTTLDEDNATLAFDDPNRKIYVAHIHRREQPQQISPPVSD